MTFAVGDIVIPRRRYLARTTPYLTSAAGVRQYDEDRLIDWYLLRSGFAVVTEVVGAAPMVTHFFDRSGRAPFRAIGYNVAAWAPATVYTAGQHVVSDAQLWLCTVGGTSDVTAPSGTAGTFLESGGVAWAALPGPESYDGTIGAVQTGTLYEVAVWNVDLPGFVVAYYPEAELTAPTSYAAWMDLPSSDLRMSNPEKVLPYVASGHIDLGAPPAEVVDLARAYELAGVDPRS